MTIYKNLKTKYANRLSRKKNSGAAMVVAIIVIAVLMVFTFSLILVSYTLFASQNKRVASKKCSEAANSLSLAMASELDSSKNENAYKNSDFWIYLRYHLMQGDWPFYEPKLEGHRESNAFKSFEMMVNPNYIPSGKSTIDGYPGSVKIRAYWMLPKTLYDEHSIETEPDFFRTYTFSDWSDKSGVRLFLEITCESASQSYTVKNEYYLSIVPYDSTDPDQESEMTILASYATSPLYNSDHKTIMSGERWRWVFEKRE